MLDPVFRFRPLGSIAQETWSAFLVGAPHEIFQPMWAVLPGLILLALGVLVGFLSKEWRQSAWIVLAYLVIPLLTFYTTMYVMPIYIGPRHIIFLVPPVYILMAVGVAWLWARRRLFALGALAVQVGLMMWWLTVQFRDPTYLKDDIRSAACTKGKGYLISVGATKGQKMFDCVLLTARYFFDAIDMELAQSLLYRQIDAKGAIRNHPDALIEAYELGLAVAKP